MFIPTLKYLSYGFYKNGEKHGFCREFYNENYMVDKIGGVEGPDTKILLSEFE